MLFNYVCYNRKITKKTDSPQASRIHIRHADGSQFTVEMIEDVDGQYEGATQFCSHKFPGLCCPKVKTIGEIKWFSETMK